MAENPFLPTEPWMCTRGTPSSSGNTVPKPVSSHGSSRTMVCGETFSPMGTEGPVTISDPQSTAPTRETAARAIPLSMQNASMTSCRTSPSTSLRTKTLPCLSSALFI